MSGAQRETEETTTTAVTIYGQTYHLKGSTDQGYLQDLAGLVDRKMREVVEATGTADTQKVAILAALNLADDFMQARRGRAVPVDDRDDERLAHLTTLLGEALTG